MTTVRPDALRTVAGVPGTRQEWVTASAQVSGVLLGLRTAERLRGAALPDPLDDGRALRAWTRVVRAVLDRRGDEVARIGGSDVEVVGDTADALGRALCRWRARGTGSVVDDLLRCDAATYHVTPESLVAHVARVHGVLTGEDPASARLLWQAGGTGPETDHHTDETVTGGGS